MNIIGEFVGVDCVESSSDFESGGWARWDRNENVRVNSVVV
jgi:hypothetical protein